MLCLQRVYPSRFVCGGRSVWVKSEAGECGMGAKEPPLVEGHTQRDEEVTVDVFEVSGSIKWFDASKGYGFIVPDEDLPDVLLHVTCLRRDGFQTAYEGARIVCEVLRRQKGLQAFRIRAMDNSTAMHPSQLPQRTHVMVIPESDWESAMVKWFNRLRGFGFLTRGSQSLDIFVHMETLRRFGFTELRPGQTVLVRYGRGPKGLMAAELKPDGLARSFLSLISPRHFAGSAVCRRWRRRFAHANAVRHATGTLGAENRYRPATFHHRTRHHRARAGVGSDVSAELAAGCRHAVPLRSAATDFMWMKNTLIPLDMIFIGPTAGCTASSATPSPSQPG